eukprot:EG_transcript_24244
MPYSEYDYVVKVVVVGDSGVGKTSLLLRYADDTYDDRYLATIGVDFRITTMEIGNKVAKLQLWDTAGQERFRGITQNYYRAAQAVVICFDLTDLESFQNCKKWMSDVETYCPADVTKMMIGTKVDLTSKRVVSFQDAQAFADQYGCPYFETSAKASTQVADAFQSLVQKIVTEREKKNQVEVKDKTPFTLQQGRNVQKDRSCFGWLGSFFF